MKALRAEGMSEADAIAFMKKYGVYSDAPWNR